MADARRMPRATRLDLIADDGSPGIGTNGARSSQRSSATIAVGFPDDFRLPSETGDPSQQGKNIRLLCPRNMMGLWNETVAPRCSALQGSVGSPRAGRPDLDRSSRRQRHPHQLRSRSPPLPTVHRARGARGLPRTRNGLVLTALPAEGSGRP